MFPEVIQFSEGEVLWRDLHGFHQGTLEDFHRAHGPHRGRPWKANRHRYGR